MQEKEFYEFLQKSGLTINGVKSRITRGRQIESLFNLGLDTIVSSDSLMENTIKNLKVNDHHGNLQNALRKYYLFKNNKEFDFFVLGNTSSTTNPTIQLSSISDSDILDLYGQIYQSLVKRHMVRTRNVTGDIGEWLFSKAFNIPLVPPSVKGYDAIDPTNNIKYQVKTMIDRTSKSRQLTSIRDLNFDYLIAIVLDNSYSVLEAYQIPMKTVEKYAKRNSYQNCYILFLNKTLLNDPSVLDISSRF